MRSRASRARYCSFLPQLLQRLEPQLAQLAVRRIRSERDVGQCCECTCAGHALIVYSGDPIPEPINCPKHGLQQIHLIGYVSLPHAQASLF